MLLSNYRPVSVSPEFSNTLDRIMFSKLVSFVNKHTFLYKS